MIDIEQKLLEFEKIYSTCYDKTTEEICKLLEIDINVFYEWKTNDRYSERIKNFFAIQKMKRIDNLAENALIELQKKVLQSIEIINVVKTSKRIEKPKDEGQLLLIEPITNIVAIQEEVHTRTVAPSSSDLKWAIEKSRELNETISIAGGQLDLSVLSAEEQIVIMPLLNKIINATKNGD